MGTGLRTSGLGMLTIVQTLDGSALDAKVTGLPLADYGSADGCRCDTLCRRSELVKW